MWLKGIELPLDLFIRMKSLAMKGWSLGKATCAQLLRLDRECRLLTKEIKILEQEPSARPWQVSGAMEVP